MNREIDGPKKLFPEYCHLNKGFVLYDFPFKKKMTTAIAGII